ncbi:unnamed protein product [Brassicogethes aeneus]|uniref:15-hydroxyprostaglandin dehydrogenase n=1 Tax=Brassicogethes aeneus TaxID=1431903 RepID=A0A9P0B2B6_BRAAE|nr:unnamed protein product [Brassicogethes aeneus]
MLHQNCMKITRSILPLHRNVRTLEESKLKRSYSDAPAFKGRVGIITGGASGVGLSIVKALVPHEPKALIIVDNDKAMGEELAGALKKQLGPCCDIDFEHVDVVKKDQMQKVFECAKKKYCYIDLVVNNANMKSESEWERTLCTNTFGMVNVTHLAFEYMGKHKCLPGGTVINVLGVSAVDPDFVLPVTSGTKHFGLTFTRLIGHEWFFSRTGIRVMGVLPGPTETKKNLKNLLDTRGLGDVNELVKAASQSKPQKPDEVAMCVMKMIDIAESSDIYVVDGGKCGKIYDFPDRRGFKRCTFE